MSKKKLKHKTNSPPSIKKEDWPVVVYMSAMVVGILSYFVIGEGVLELQPHPIHWLAGLVGAILGIGVGWIWYRYRGDII